MRRSQSHEEENPYWISFSDLMIALLTVFILAVVVLVLQLTNKQEALADQQKTAAQQHSELTQQVQALQQAENVRAEMLKEIAGTLTKKGIEVTVSENGSVLNIRTEQLGFESGAYEIRPEHEDVAVTIGRTIADALTTDERYRYLDTVFIEGHTDNRPAPGLEGTGNWGLSTFRAISLWRLWEDELPQRERLQDLKSRDGQPLFSVSGYGSTRPLAKTQKTEKQRAANRRIDVRFTVVHPTADQLAEILDLDATSSKK